MKDYIKYPQMKRNLKARREPEKIRPGTPCKVLANLLYGQAKCIVIKADYKEGRYVVRNLQSGSKTTCFRTMIDTR